MSGRVSFISVTISDSSSGGNQGRNVWTVLWDAVATYEQEHVHGIIGVEPSQKGEHVFNDILGS
jgi:hypothetical protein